MTEVNIRKEGRAGRITLTRPKALNALTHDMILNIDAALIAWRGEVDLVLIDAEGEKAFCAGGDLQALYDSAKAGDMVYGARMWRDEYRMNDRVGAYPVPVVSFLHGFTMGGGVGLGGHASHRIVGESSRVAMPECGIGLVPDVGGSRLLSNAPGAMGRYLGLTGTRMDAADALFAGFADHYVPEAEWEALKAKLIETGDVSVIDEVAKAPGSSAMEAAQDEISARFNKPLEDIAQSSVGSDDPAAQAIGRSSPLAMACHAAILERLGPQPSLRAALEMEYRYVCRSVKNGEFVEGIRALIVDRDKSPKWLHGSISEVSEADVEAMLAPLDEEMTWEDDA